MRGAHSRVLANRDWGELSLESLTDTSDQVATAFARYPYPESFFSWQHDSPQGVVFFNRANRFPAWMPQPTEPNRYPVALVTNPPEAEALREKVAAFSAARFRYATFDMTLGGQPYQIVARLVYADPLQETLHSVIGFTVNLAWVRQSYFSDILSQVAPIATRGNSLDIARARRERPASLGTRKRRRRRWSANFRCCFSTRQSAWSRSASTRPSGPGRSARASQPTLRWSARRRARTKRCSPRRGGADAGARADSRDPGRSRRRRADGDALRLRLVGHPRVENAAREHPRDGRHARAPADRRRNRARLRRAAHAGSDGG